MVDGVELIDGQRWRMEISPVLRERAVPACFTRQRLQMRPPCPSFQPGKGNSLQRQRGNGEKRLFRALQTTDCSIRRGKLFRVQRVVKKTKGKGIEKAEGKEKEQHDKNERSAFHCLRISRYPPGCQYVR